MRTFAILTMADKSFSMSLRFATLVPWAPEKKIPARSGGFAWSVPWSGEAPNKEVPKRKASAARQSFPCEGETVRNRKVPEGSRPRAPDSRIDLKDGVTLSPCALLPGRMLCHRWQQRRCDPGHTTNRSTLQV